MFLAFFFFSFKLLKQWRELKIPYIWLPNGVLSIIAECSAVLRRFLEETMAGFSVNLSLSLPLNSRHYYLCPMSWPNILTRAERRACTRGQEEFYKFDLSKFVKKKVIGILDHSLHVNWLFQDR